MADEQNFGHRDFLAFFGSIISHGLEECNKRPPCVKGAVCEADWGIDNPSDLAVARPPPFTQVRLFVGKSYASKVDDEKSAFEQRNKYPTI